MPLSQAFWTWAVGIGVAVNVVTSALFLVLMMQQQVVAAFVAGYLLSVPYNIVAAVGVWRAAARYPGPYALAQAARWAVLVGMIVLSVT